MTTPPPGGYPPTENYPQPFVPPVKRRNTLGLVALILAVVGLVLTPFAMVASAVLLPVAFILGIVGLCLPGRTRATSAGAVAVSTLAVVLVIALVVVSMVRGVFDDAFNSWGASSPETTTETETPAAPPPGSRQNPLPIGETVVGNGWTVTLGTPREAAAEVVAEDPANAAPAPGMEFWIVPVHAVYTYDGGTPMRPSLEVWVEFTGGDGRVYRDGCGRIPDALLAVGEMHRGDAVDANACVAVPSGADGLWTLTIAIFSDPVYFTAE